MKIILALKVKYSEFIQSGHFHYLHVLTKQVSGISVKIEQSLIVEFYHGIRVSP